MSRTRLLRPDFFKDELMAGLPITTRYVYMGLWTLCDDAGYFERKPRQIAAELFPYDGLAHRQRVVDKALEELLGAGRVRYLACGFHGIIPTLPKHGAKGGTKSETYKSRHGSCSSGQVRTDTDKSSSDSGLGSVGGSEGAPARKTLREAAEEAGGFVAAVAARGRP